MQRTRDGSLVTNNATLFKWMICKIQTISPFHCYMLKLRYYHFFSMNFLWEIQIGTLINSDNAEASLFTFCKSSIKM
jgi:hypothetical protein